MGTNLQKQLVLSGAVGPVIFFLVILILGFVFPGYDHVTQYISELGAVDSPVAAYMNVVGFMLLGIFIMLFSVSLFFSSELTTLGKLSIPFFFITGILMFLVGVFPCDAGCNNFSAIGELHELASDTPFAVMTVALILFAVSAWSNQKLRILTPTILGLGIITLIFTYFYIIAETPTSFPGIIQRLAIGIPFFILFVIALKLYFAQRTK